MNFILRLVIAAVAVWVAAFFVPGISFAQTDSATTQIITILIVGAIFGVLNAVIRPILFFLSLPLLLLTLGLFTFILNAFMLVMTSWVSGQLGLGFDVDGIFWAGIFGSLIISIVSTILSLLLVDD